MPLSIVLESRYDIKNVIPIPRIKNSVNANAASKEVPALFSIPTKNIVTMAISVGNRPLHGTKLLVRIAMRRSLGESIILQPVTPTALQPNPMHMEILYLHESVKKRIPADPYAPGSPTLLKAFAFLSNKARNPQFDMDPGSILTYFIVPPPSSTLPEFTLI